LPEAQQTFQATSRRIGKDPIKRERLVMKKKLSVGTIEQSLLYGSCSYLELARMRCNFFCIAGLILHIWIQLRLITARPGE
jgi:hypothetical protein